MSQRDTPSHLLVTGLLLALAAALTFGSIGLYFASGAVADDPSDPVVTGEAYAGASDHLVTSAYLGVAGNVLVAVAALMLAHASSFAVGGVHRRVHLPGVWATLVLGALFIVPFDLALPRGLIPLARADPTSPVFAALYETLNLAHSVGLVVFYAATTALFAHQASTAATTAHKMGWRVMTGVSVAAVVVGVGLTVGTPPMALVPSVFLTWAGVLWLGVRMATRDARGTSSEATGSAGVAHDP